jgi:hypothetical protein
MSNTITLRQYNVKSVSCLEGIHKIIFLNVKAYCGILSECYAYVHGNADQGQGSEPAQNVFRHI